MCQDHVLRIPCCIPGGVLRGRLDRLGREAPRGRLERPLEGTTVDGLLLPCLLARPFGFRPLPRPGRTWRRRSWQPQRRSSRRSSRGSSIQPTRALASRQGMVRRGRRPSGRARHQQHSRGEAAAAEELARAKRSWAPCSASRAWLPVEQDATPLLDLVPAAECNPRAAVRSPFGQLTA